MIEDINERGEREARQNEELLRQTAEKLEQERKAKEKEEEDERKREMEKAAAGDSVPSSGGRTGDVKDRQEKEPVTSECKLLPPKHFLWEM